MPKAILERMESHLKAKLQETWIIETPKWGDESGPLVIYCRPMTLKEKDEIYRFASQNSLKPLAATLQ